MNRFFPVLIFAALLACRSGAQTALTVSTPAITVAPSFVPGSPVLAPPAPASVPAINSAAMVASLSQALFVLQTNVQEALPLVTFFNDNFDFMSLLNNSFANATAPPPNMSANLSTNFAGNFGVNTAVSTGPPLITTPSVSTPATTATPVASVAPASGFASLPMSRDTLRALLVLQSDMERLLPLLNALNGGPANPNGTFTNLFGVV